MAEPSSAATLPSPDDRAAEVAELLVGAVDLHCHSGPAAMPRILDHHEALMDAAAARFKALLYKDHFYLGVSHAVMLEKLFPETGVRLFSGIALNNASGGINPHAVDHAVKIGAKIVWMPTLSAANHLRQAEGQAKNFPATAKKMMEAEPLTSLDPNGQVSDPARKVLDLIAEADVILASGHLHVSELFVLFEEARRRGVTKLLVNHPTYVIGCTDADMRALAALGAYLEHEAGMFIDGKAKLHDAADLAHLLEVGGVERTVISSDLGLTGSPRPIEGFRNIVRMLLDLQVPKADIRRLVGTNAAGLLGLSDEGTEATAVR